MEYFNSFGGNPVSCAIGQSVLKVIKEEGLQENALAVGNYLLDRLKKLQSQHDLIGEVRGRGLFIGIELVNDELVPASAEAQNIVNNMKDKGFLLGTDGPNRNVIKIKPPMVFTRENANELASILNEVIKGM
jgi:4-aminobutyrate aminotransferase-like enzyme